MTHVFTFPKKPTRVVDFRTIRNQELIDRVIKIKRSGHQDSVRIAA